MSATTKPSSGWNRSNSTPKPAPKKPSAFKGVLAGVLIVAALGAVCWFLFDTDKGPADLSVSRSRTIKDKSYKKLDDISRIKPRKEYAEKPKTADEALQRVEEAQEPMKLAPIPKAAVKVPKMMFNSGTEQVLSWLCCVKLGETPIPPPPMPEEELANLANILVSKNEIKEDDSEAAAELKQMVDSAKKEMIKFIKDGGDPDEFMQYVFREQMKAFETRNTAQEMYEDMIEEDPEMAREFAKKANEKLTEQGILPIELPEEEAESQEQQQEVQQ